MVTLRLEVPRFDDARHWDWRLLDTDGQLVAYDEVSLDPPSGEEQEAQKGTADWMRRFVATASDRSAAMNEARRWLGEHVLPKVGQAIADEAPATVHVRIPEMAVALLNYPLELASVADASSDGNFIDLAENDVAFVYEVFDTKAGASKDAVHGTLRVLAIFSEPEGATFSTLYVEQRRLTSRIDQIASQYDKSIELQILPYGTTQQRLKDCLEEGEGWDIIHISGYGVINGLAMWESEPLPMTQLAKELKHTRHRLKAITLIDREHPAHAHDNGAGQQEAPAPSASVIGDRAIIAVASDLSRTLGCAVFAFRYPACEKFAMTFVQELFVNLLGKKEQRLPGAVQLANKSTSERIVGVQGWCCRPGPVLFGSQAVSLSLAPPNQPKLVDFDVRRLKMTSFPNEPPSSETPIALRVRAGNALGSSSVHRGVVLVGPAASTRSCALELAYEHRDDFQALVWHQGPTASSDVPGSFDDLIRSLDRQLVNLHMADQVDTDQALHDFMPKLSGLLRTRLVLLVIADVDMLLTSQGNWTNPSWQLVIEAMYEHTGGSRLIITSNHAPLGTGDRMEFVDMVPISASDDPDSSHSEMPGLDGS